MILSTGRGSTERSGFSGRFPAETDCSGLKTSPLTAGAGGNEAAGGGAFGGRLDVALVRRYVADTRDDVGWDG